MKVRRSTISLAVLLLACKGAPKPRVPDVVHVDAAVESPSAAHDEHAVEPWTREKLAQNAQLLPGLEQVRRKVTTVSPEAQAFFDQGLALLYGFNHDEAARSFARASELDPSCALCFWGLAYALGPNYNVPMLPERALLAWEALTSARRLATNTTQTAAVEQALIEALAERYQGPEHLDPAAMQPRNVAYAEAMRAAARKFPHDDDVQVLFAEALMNVNPWKLWQPDGSPAPGTRDILVTLEFVLMHNPKHVGANHYYIHAIEASKTPDKGLAAADRLGALLPGAGHTVHMPAHIYQRVGRYADASAANRAAVVVDQAYLQAVTPPGYYPIYLAHNYGFLAYSSAMQGRAEESIAAARSSAGSMPRDVVCGMPGMDFFLSEPLLALVRFGRFQELLAEPAPDPKYAAWTALYRHARGMALAGTGQLDAARAEIGAIRSSASELNDELITGLNQGKRVLELAAKVLEARVAELAHEPNALAAYREAVALEDDLAYNEPADWFYPTRHYLGAALLDAGEPVEAEAVYRADLERHPHNGWALFGLAQALAAQKKGKEQKLAEQAFKAAWKDADIALTRSAF